MVGDSVAAGGAVMVDSALTGDSAAFAAASGVVAGLAAGATVSVFCSQAASNAAPARMQMYFFIDKIQLLDDSNPGRFAVWRINN